MGGVSLGAFNDELLAHLPLVAVVRGGGPLAGRVRHFTVAGTWRDYARAFGAIVITRPAYIEATGDTDANEGSLWLDGGANAGAVEARLRGSSPAAAPETPRPRS